MCVECPRCHQSSLTLLEGEASRCAFCLWKPVDGAECAAEYVDTVLGISHHMAIKDGGEWPIYPCAACGEVSLVEGIEQQRPDPGSLDRDELPCDWKAPAYWGCFACGMTADRLEVEHCARCSTPTTTGSDDGIPVCSECWADVLHD